jgi:hypothetical protein
MDSPASTDADTNVVIAKLIALAARNGVEDLHANGAFSDRQAPALNRLLRGRVYEFLVATSRSEADGQSGAPSAAALRGAVGRAVDEFAVVEGIDEGTALKLRRAAIRGAVEAFQRTRRVALGRSRDVERDQMAVQWWLQSIPDYWEDPLVSVEFQALLDAYKEDRGAPPNLEQSP